MHINKHEHLGPLCKCTRFRGSFLYAVLGRLMALKANGTYAKEKAHEHNCNLTHKHN